MEEDNRICGACGAVNPPEAARCCTCGRSLDPAEAIIEARLVNLEDRLDRIRQDASAIKAQAETASQQRLSTWWAEEEARQRALAAERAERERQERKLLLGALGFAAVVLGLVILYVVLATAGR